MVDPLGLDRGELLSLAHMADSRVEGPDGGELEKRATHRW
jgi:hypothetical protein